MASTEQALRHFLDRAEIQDVLYRYARGVDRRDWALVRAAYHPDAHDDHGGYKGGVDGLIEWLVKRFADVVNSTHVIGNCLVEFASDDDARVETYFVSSRLRAAEHHECGAKDGEDAMCRQSWGRYLDQFERRDGAWRIARRAVVVDAAYRFLVHDGLKEALPAQTGVNDVD